MNYIIYDFDGGFIGGSSFGGGFDYFEFESRDRLELKVGGSN